MDSLIQQLLFAKPPTMQKSHHYSFGQQLLDYLGRQLLRHAEAKTWLQQRVYCSTKLKWEHSRQCTLLSNTFT